jgi:subtilase family serine protease
VRLRAGLWLLASSLGLALAACGGGGVDAPGVVAADTTAVAAGSAAVPDLLPAFHLAAVSPAEPADTDADGQGLSAYQAATTVDVPPRWAGVQTAGLTPEDIAGFGRLSNALAAVTVRPQAATAAVTVFTPAQIRAAYGMPPLPTSWVGLPAATAANFGAGQTVYVVDAYDHPNVLADLNAFSAKFGLPTCAVLTVASSSRLPLAAPGAASGCSFAKVTATLAGTLSPAAVAYNAGWATEIALDVQWVHATAPLARIVLVEAASASLDSLYGAIRLANAMGPGAVSMSFGAPEGSWTASYDAAFTAAGMSYFAATGDAGASVQWPAVSAGVTAVSGTSLSYGGSGNRSEVVWSGTGGGVSAYTPMPAYQASVAVPGQPLAKAGTAAMRRRGVADVAFNANPNTGQYIAFTAPGAKLPSWYVAGGTSLATPQWAGLAAVANAQRAGYGKAPLTLFNAVLYPKVAAVVAAYAQAFLDIRSGSDGSCGTCAAGPAYDLPTGLGTPTVAGLLPLLVAN